MKKTSAITFRNFHEELDENELSKVYRPSPIGRRKDLDQEHAVDGGLHDSSFSLKPNRPNSSLRGPLHVPDVLPERLGRLDVHPLESCELHASPSQEAKLDNVKCNSPYSVKIHEDLTRLARR